MSPKRRHDGDDDGDRVGKSSKGDIGSRKATFKAFLTALNSQFASWVQDQKSSHPSELWLDGVRDYIGHAEELLADFKDVLEAEKQPGSVKQVTFGSSNGGSATTTPAFGVSAAKDTPVSLFGSAASQPTGNTTNAGGAFSFGAGTSSAPADATTTTAAPASAANPFSFGAKPAGDAAASGPAVGSTGGGLFAFGGASNATTTSNTAPASFFSFAGTSAAGSSAAAPFAFGGAAASGSAAAAGGAAGGEEEGEEEGPQKFESEIVANEDAGKVHYKCKSKMMHFKKNENGKSAWDTKGVGLVQLRTRKEDPTKPFVTFTTESGRVLYIASIPKSMTVIVNDAKNMLSWSAPWSPDGTSPPALHMVGMIMPKGKHTELKAELEKLQAAMP